jgi:hypothetical protein
MTVLGATHPPRFPIGHSDYLHLRRRGLTYVDKTMWIAEMLDDPALVTVIPRPRRFGKTLNMTTLRYFVERTDESRADVFEDTAVWTAAGGKYRSEFQRYPVIYLGLKDTKENSWALCWARVRDLIRGEAQRLSEQYELQQVLVANPLILERLSRLLAPEASYTDLVAGLEVLLVALFKATGERVVVLIDEYDAPLHAAWQHGFWNEAIGFFRNFLSSGLKDNPHLHKAVLTGILKVAKEGIFSGLNHLQTATILTSHLSNHFGFAEAEVQELASLAGVENELETLQHWYNGYRFGRHDPHTMFNPWSILRFLSAPKDGAQSFWKNTSDNALIHSLLMRHAASFGPAIETLLGGGTIERIIDENVALTQLDESTDALAGLLLFSGYLTAASVTPTAAGVVVVLRIPNLEVRGIFADTFLNWLRRGHGATGIGLRTSVVQGLVDAMLRGDVESFAEELEARLVTMLSYHDVAGDRVEAVYQAFIVGMLVDLQQTYRVYSNRESGFGRADVMIVARQPGPGAVLELKRISPRETPEVALERALAQLRARDYAAEVRAAGATEVYQYGIVFDGKRCWVRRLELG